jgi:ketosteroid isomerase-like protein
MMRSLFLAGLITCAVAFGQTQTELTEQVRRTETAFAKTMAGRNAEAFASFLSPEAVFMSNGQVSRGPHEVSERWKRYFEGAQPPFSWEPEQVQVLDSGTLAMTSGPVKDPAGKRIGTFNSVWRREANGPWKIVFDSGCPACTCEAK